MPVPNPPVIAETQPAPPQRYVDDRVTYSTRLDDWLTWFTTKAWVWLYDLVPWIQARANETEAWASAAAAVPNATVWVSGATYAQYVAAIDPIKLLTYRRKTAAGSGTVRPELDATNWEPVTGTGNVTNTAANTFTAPQTFTGGIAGVPIGTPNLLINPEGFINQRVYVSGTATTTANQYTVDRWRVVVGGQNLSWTDSGGVRTFTCPAGGVEQVIEGSNIRIGLHVLNWQGTATATINGVAVLKGATVNLTGGSNVTIRFINGTMSLPRFEPGAVATPFWSRLGGTELSLCQRYRESGATKIYVSGAGLVAIATNFRVQKRAVPTMFYASSPAGSTVLSLTIEWVTTTSFAVNATNQELAFSWVADAEIY